jgi:hypothetical protein
VSAEPLPVRPRPQPSCTRWSAMGTAV